jgi:hypothetical protein
MMLRLDEAANSEDLSSWGLTRNNVGAYVAYKSRGRVPHMYDGTTLPYIRRKFPSIRRDFFFKFPGSLLLTFYRNWNNSICSTLSIFLP